MGRRWSSCIPASRTAESGIRSGRGAATSEALAASEEMEAYDAAVEEAFERDDLDGAVQADLRMWVDGPRRGPGEVDPTIRAKVATMQHDAYVLTSGFETWSEEPLVSDLPARLHEVAAPTLVILGELDVGVIREQAEAFAATIPGARLEMLPGTAHVPSLERPEAFDALVLPFLDEHASAARPTA